MKYYYINAYDNKTKTVQSVARSPTREEAERWLEIWIRVLDLGELDAWISESARGQEVNWLDRKERIPRCLIVKT